MRKQTGRKLMAGILAAVMMVTSVSETVYAAEKTGRTKQKNSAWAEEGNNVDEKIDSEEEIEVETSDEKNDIENESNADAANDKIDKDDENGEEIPDQDNVSGEENESQTLDNEGNSEETDEDTGVDRPDNTEIDDTSSEEYFETEDERDFPEESEEANFITVYADNGGYPYSVAAGVYIADKWRFYQCECTSFVAYCLNERNGFSFSNFMYGTSDDKKWGDANHWKTVAQQNGFTVDSNPVVGAVAWTGSGSTGHVAWVSAVNGNQVTIEEYNNGYVIINGEYHGNHKYGTRTVDKSAFQYIHIKDISEPQPERGSEMTGPFTRTIPDGDYHIITALDTDMCLTIDYASTENGANANIFHSTEQDDQVWTVAWLGSDKGYKITHRYSGKSLTVDGDDKQLNGLNVDQWGWYEDTGQMWIIDEVDQGAHYTIQAKCSGYYLDVANGAVAGETNVQICRWITADNLAQRWRFIPAGTQTIQNGDYYIMTDVAGNMCLDIQSSSTADVANVIISGKTGQRSQIFTVRYLNNGFYKILNKNSGMSLDVCEGLAKRGTNVLQCSDHGGFNQQWTIRGSDDGSYYIQPRHSGHYLDVANGQAAEGTNVWTTVWMGGASAQKWRFVPVEKPKLAPPTPSMPSGAVVEGGTRIFLDGGNADHIYFTWDGTDPRTSSTRNSYYTGFDRSGIAVFSSWETMTIKAYAVKEGYQDSDVAEFTYIVAENMVSKLAPPTASIPSGTEVEAGTAVSLLSGVNGAAIYYTLDGTNPSKESFHYTKPFIIEKDTVITAYVVRDGYEDSDPAVFTYMVKSQDDYGQGDVLDEDIPQGKVENIPQGLWMSAVSSQIYTGKAIKPQVRVYDHTTLLTEKKDYTISYKNNVKANVVSSVNVPTITVTGKGNYTGKEVQTFVIRPKRLEDIDIMADDITLQYNGKVQKPLPVVTWNGKKLTKNKDYTVSYPNEESDGVANPTAYIKAGTYTVLVKGMGNYIGEKTINLTITQSKSASTMTVAKIADHTYTGTEVRPVPVVKSGKVVLTEGEDYEVSYQNNIKVGTATVIITGKGSYAGVKKVTFKIVPRASLNKARAELEFDSPLVYNGRAVRPDRCRLTVSEKNADGRTVAVTLTEGADYEASYRNDNKAGTATVIFQGINGYSGTLKKTYKIAPYDIGKDEADLTEEAQKIRIELADSYAYVKGGCKPEPVVTYQGKVLTKGTDYTLSYRNNNGLNDGSNPKKQSVVIVKGKGCFKGTREKPYRITSKEIGRLTMTAADRVWQNKGNIYKTKVAIKDENGMALSAGKDYDSAFTYEYNSDTVLSDGTLRYARERITAQDIIPAGTVIRVTAAAKGSNYSGTVSCVYRITKADIGKAVVTIPAQTYTGRAITPENEIRIKLNGQILPTENYKITGYSNNINKGTATVTISGINDCGGTKTAKFKIKGKGLLWWWR